MSGDEWGLWEEQTGREGGMMTKSVRHLRSHVSDGNEGVLPVDERCYQGKGMVMH